MGTVDERTVEGELPEPDRNEHSEADVDTAELPLLTRLNARGFRLVQAADLLAILAILVGTMVVRSGWDWPTYPKSAYAVSFAVITVIFLTTIYFGGLYEREPRLGSPPVLPRAMQVTIGAGGLTALLILVASGLAREFGFQPSGGGRALPIPIANLLILILLGAIAITTNRRLVHFLRNRREGPPKLLLVGDPDEVDLAMQHLSTDPDRARVVAHTGDVDHLVQEVEQSEATDVVLLSSRWLDHLYPEILRILEARNITVLQRVSAKETIFGLERVREVGGLPFVLLRSHTMPVSREHFKRFTDMTMLMLLLPIVVPLLLFTAVYELVVVRPPILYRQARIGRDGRPFQIVKFRTMVLHAEEDGRPRLASQDDPRIIPACKWLRATRLDELPQLWNVVKGEMSLVGPRPERPELTREFEKAIPGYSRRYEIAPGLTGLAQVQGRYHTDAEYKLGYDLQYLVNWSPVLDTQIILRTIWVILTQRV